MVALSYGLTGVAIFKMVISANFMIQGDLDVYSKTASKYDDCRVLRLPQLTLWLVVFHCSSSSQFFFSVHKTFVSTVSISVGMPKFSNKAAHGVLLIAHCFLPLYKVIVSIR